MATYKIDLPSVLLGTEVDPEHYMLGVCDFLVFTRVDNCPESPGKLNFWLLNLIRPLKALGILGSQLDACIE